MAQRGLSVALVAVLALAACGTPAPKPLPPAAAPVAPPPSPPPAPPQPVAAAPSPPKDQCGADALQPLVGKPRTEIPIPVNPGLRRVVCSTCMITQDYRPNRQTITYDSSTGLVTSVKCG
jgi:hypothetical protein